MSHVAKFCVTRWIVPAHGQEACGVATCCHCRVDADVLAGPAARVFLPRLACWRHCALLSLVVEDTRASVPLPSLASGGRFGNSDSRGYRRLALLAGGTSQRTCDRLLLGVSWRTAVVRSHARWMPLDPELGAGEVSEKCLLTKVSFYQDSPSGISSPEPV